MLNFKSIIKVISSNIVVLISGIIITFILPKLITPTQYGYYSLFNLYISYAGITLLGYVDGIYLKYGGKKYENLDVKEFSTYFWKVVIWEIIIAIALLVIIIKFEEGEKQYILLFTAIGIMLESISSFFMNVDKMTARFDIFAKENILYKTLLLIFILICFLLNINTYKYLFICLIVCKVITLIYQIYNSSKFVFNWPLLLKKEYYKNDIENIKMGFVLTLSLVCTMLMTGFGKLLIEHKLGVEQLGYYAFMFSIMSLFTLVINSISTVLYPEMRNINSKSQSEMNKKLYNIVELFIPILLICYYPCVFIIQIFFNEYINILDFLIYLFPIIMVQAKITIIYNNYYKVLRKENKLLVNTGIAMLLCVFITMFVFHFWPSVESVAMSTFISFKVWEIINIIYFKKNNFLKVKIIGISDLLIILSFILDIIFSNNVIIPMGIMICVYGAILIKNRREVGNLYKKIKRRNNNE